MLNTTCIEKPDQKLSSDTWYIFAELKIAFTLYQQFTLGLVMVKWGRERWQDKI